MKKLLLLLSLTVSGFLSAQVIIFPDPNLETKLLSLGVDTNDNNQIEVAEAFAVSSLNLSASNISDLAGLEFFENLTHLQCNQNQIADLSPLAGLMNLTELRCNQNQITNVDAIMGLPLQKLFCFDNQITHLDITPLAETLLTLSCGWNQLTNSTLNLAPDTNNLTSLSLNNNLLTTFTYHCDDMAYLNVQDNPITELNLSGTADFIEIETLGTSLDLSDIVFGELGLDGSNLTHLNLKNGNPESVYMLLMGLNSLQYLCANEVDVPGLINDFSANQNPPVINSYCSFTPGGTFYTISGENRLDANGNGCDASDTSFPSLQYQITDGTLTGSVISDVSGAYSLPVSAGTHTITPVLENPDYFTVTPSTITVTFPDEASPLSQDFCLIPNGTFEDTEIIIVPTVPARPGFDAVYTIIYKNKGNTAVSGSVLFNFDDEILDYISADLSPTNINNNELVWQFTNLLPFETRVISLTFSVNSPMETPAVNIGDILNFTAAIHGESEDVTPLDNSSVLSQAAVGAYDPNDIICLEGDTVGPEMAGQYVHYLIRFENTGNSPAANIVVKDMIDPSSLDVTTLIPLHSSHDFITRITGNKVEFIFENINLPFDDANNDGFVAFKIKTLPTLVLGDTFSNTAAIYFDYNFPIITNTETTTIEMLGREDFNFSSYFTIYPNPASQGLNIESVEAIELKSISIYNMLGQQLIVIPNAQEVSAVDVSSLRSGTYFIRITSDHGTSASKFVKQ